MAEEAKWYVVHTYSGYESKVAGNLMTIVENRNLQDMIQEVRIPTETVTETRDGVKKEIERKLFPSYVFVKMVLTDATWGVVRYTRGCTGFVGPNGADGKPIPLTEKEVASLGVEKKEIIVNYAVGDIVTITDGPMENFSGRVDEIDQEKNMVRVVISMFGRETPVELELDQVELMD